MEAIIRNHEIAYFSLNSVTYQKTAYCTARLVLQDIQAVAPAAGVRHHPHLRG